MINKPGLLSVIAFLLVFAALGQGIVLYDADENVITGDTLWITGEHTADIIRADVFFYNNTEDTLEVMVRKIEADILEGTYNAFCWNNYCFSPDVYESPEPISLLPHHTSSDTDFYAEYYPYSQVGQSIIQYEFFSRQEAFETVWVTVVFITQNTTHANGSINQPNIISGPMPNPATGHTVLRYDLPAGIQTAFLEVRTISGRMAEKVRLDIAGNTIRIDTNHLPGGTYLYSLVADGRILTTGLFMVCN